MVFSLEAVKQRLTSRPGRLSVEEYAQKLLDKGIGSDGHFVPDPIPMAPPIGYKKAPSMIEIVRDMVRSEKLAQAAAAAGHETFEEAEDFDVDDDPVQLKSGWENDFDPPIAEVKEAVEADKASGV